MEHQIFRGADILLPARGEPEKWAVIACDQFSSDRGYWERVENNVGTAPSTLNLIVPEALLGEINTEEASEERAAAMEEYLGYGVFKTLRNALVYVERTVTGEKLRRGLVGCIDLDAYDYSEGSASPIRASEKTVADRLPPRIAVRRRAPLEAPHVMVLIDDKDESVIEPLGKIKDTLPKLYGFELMEGGGHIEGYAVTGDALQSVMSSCDRLFSRPLGMVIGDGNHSLAAAKACWDEIKTSLTEAERETHPARFALVEVNNVYGEGLDFEPIHRVVFGVDAKKFTAFLRGRFNGGGRAVRFVTEYESGEISVSASNHGELVAAVQSAIDEYISANGGTVDYIHDDDSAAEMGRKSLCCAVLLPVMERSELFATVNAGRVFPKKSFSIGHARDKRYYYECRVIKADIHTK